MMESQPCSSKSGDNDFSNILSIDPYAEEEKQHYGDYIFVNNDSSEYSGSSEDEDEEVENDPLETFLLPNIPSNVCTFSIIAPHLNAEELNIISTCEDPKLKTLLILNRLKLLRLKGLLSKFNNLLFNCNNDIYNHTSQLLEVKKVPRYPRELTGHPYFRDKKGFGPDANTDILAKVKNGEVNFSYVHKRKLLLKSFTIDLKSKVMFNYFKNKLFRYEKDLKEAKTKGDIAEQERSSQIVDDWKKNFPKMEPPEIWNDDFIDWNIIASDLSEQCPPLTCRAIWNLYIHPKINVKSFTKDEVDKFEELMEYYNYENWEAIAKELGTNRSPLMLCENYFNDMKYKKGRKIFKNYAISRKEDERLLEAVEKSRTGDHINWSKVAYLLPIHSKVKLKMRYEHIKSMENIKTGPFSEDEDILLLYLVRKFGENFDKIHREMPIRSKKQLQSHYRYFFKEQHDFTEWTVEEDELIYDFIQKNGNKWKLLSEQLQHRNVMHIRHRYNTLQKYLSDTSLDISTIPRRKKKNDNDKRKVLNEIVDSYVRSQKPPKIHFNVELTKTSKKGRPNRNHIDNLLIDFFRSTTHVRKAKNFKAITEQTVIGAANSICSVLNMLGVKLQIPNVSEINHPLIDKVDLEILPVLSKMSSSSNADISDVPPNVNTIQALRCMLLNYQKSTYKDPDEACKLERMRYHERFKALFKWPCLMSMTSPLTDCNIAVKKPKSPIKRAKGRPKRDFSKIKKMVAANANRRAFENRLKFLEDVAQPSTSAITVHINEIPAKNPVLTKVDKAAIEKLTENGGPKIIILNKNMKLKRVDRSSIPAGAKIRKLNSDDHPTTSMTENTTTKDS